MIEVQLYNYFRLPHLHKTDVLVAQPLKYNKKETLKRLFLCKFKHARKKIIYSKTLYQVHLVDLIPEHNFYRLLDTAIDFHFLYKATAQYYGEEGQESIDPVVFLKNCLVDYLNNINSDRKLIEYCSNCLDVRLFIRYDIDEPLPWHSTISRTLQLYGEEVFLSLFKAILKLCVTKGMIRGKHQAIDSVFIKANVSIDSLVEKEVLEDASASVDELEENSKFKTTSTRKKLLEQHLNWKKEAYKSQPNFNINKVDEHGNSIRPRFVSNHTHYTLIPMPG